MVSDGLCVFSAVGKYAVNFYLYDITAIRLESV